MFLAVVVDLVLLSHVAVVEAAKDVFAWGGETDQHPLCGELYSVSLTHLLLKVGLGNWLGKKIVDFWVDLVRRWSCQGGSWKREACSCSSPTRSLRSDKENIFDLDVHCISAAGSIYGSMPFFFRIPHFKAQEWTSLTLCSISHRTHRSESLSGNFLKGVSRQSGEVFVEVPVLFWSLSWSTFPLISIFSLFEGQDLRDDRLMISPPSLLQITLKITLDIVVSRWSFFLGLWGWVWWSRNALQKSIWTSWWAFPRTRSSHSVQGD